MSTSLPYHSFGLREVKYISTKYVNTSVGYHTDVTRAIESGPDYNSWKYIKKKCKISVFTHHSNRSTVRFSGFKM